MPEPFIDALKVALLDLLHELSDTNIPLIIVGGYGLYLKQLSLEANEEATLIPADLWPPPRATEDIDLLFRTEIVADEIHWARLRKALDHLGYDAMNEARFMRFQRKSAQGFMVGIDLLTGPLAPDINTDALKITNHRVRSRSVEHLHARLAEDAVGLEHGLIRLPVHGVRSSGDDFKSEVLLPHPFTFLIMKLHALRDRVNDKRKGLAQHHAIDLFRILAMLNEDEFEEVKQRIRQHQGAMKVAEARLIVREYFADRESLGALRLQEYDAGLTRLWRANFDSVGEDPIDRFCATLQEAFGDR